MNKKGYLVAIALLLTVAVIGSILGVTLSKKNKLNDDDLTVQLVDPNGIIQGHQLQSKNGADYYAFQQIPFAAPPVGENRFQEPKSAEGWSGILPTKENTKICIQSTIYPIKRNNEIKETEDCLYLNVYTPEKPGSNASLPVFVWIYGGAFIIGDASFTSYGPSYLMDYDIVIVTLNYRVGALGFLTTDDEHLPGNLGLKDQHFAIKWVSQNIHLFGGNPNKITIGGESAGAISVGFQMISKLNQGLFHGAIQQSGSSLMLSSWQPAFTNFAFALGRYLDSSFDSIDSKDLRELLLKATADDIRKYQDQVKENFTNGIMNDLVWGPIIESDMNKNPLITTPILNDFMEGNFNLIPSIVGFNSEESLPFIADVAEGLAVRAQAYDENPSLLLSTKMNVDARNTAALELKRVYTDKTFAEDIGAFVRFSSDAGFIRASLKQAELASKYVNTYVYQLSYSKTPSNIPGTDNVGHGVDIGYFWENNFSGPKNQTIQLKMLELWTNFIKYQNPTPGADTHLGTSWPNTVGDDIVYLNINETLEIKVNPRQYNQIKSVIDKYLIEPYIIY